MGLDYLEHYGMPRRSGRYPWGSGEDPYQSLQGTGGMSFMGEVKRMRDEGSSDKDIAQSMGISVNELRNRYSYESQALRNARMSEAWRLKNEKQMSNIAIAERLGVTESTVRNLLKYSEQRKKDMVQTTADILKDAVARDEFIDVGRGVNTYLNVSDTKFKAALQKLQDEGYKIQYYPVEQLGTTHSTSIKVLCAPGTEYNYLKNREKIKLPIGDYINEDTGGRTGIKPPVSIDPKRVKVRYAEEGGTLMDGVIQLRRGVEDLSLGDSLYAQVRIKVGENSYLKGMAMYADDLPKGVDIVFNTNKHVGTPMEFTDKETPSVLKGLKKTDEWEDNPFGAIVRQREYIGKDGKKHLSPINIVNEEGSWGEWKKTLSSQVLSKQPVPLAKKLLDKAYDERMKQYEEIDALTNPEVKKRLLLSFAEDCDSAASDLKAAAMPRQSSKVILPFPDMKEDEVYAPGYKDGETVCLVRYPHAGRFEIPTLKVNNKDPVADSLIHNAKDAIGINPKVAERLSGADFDGDTVLVIPNPRGEFKTAEPLKQLVGFEPKEAYRAPEGMPVVSTKTGFYKQREMGSVSNLITDMTIKGASPDELARAVKHSMVIIDAEKHNLNWKQSYEDNGIAELKAKYQGGRRRGASTLISKAGSEDRVPERKQRTSIDPETGKVVYYETGRRKKEKIGVDPVTGKPIWGEGKELVTTKTTKMATTDDAFTLSSGSEMENVYAQYANNLKALANTARKEYLGTPSIKISPSAKALYADEVAGLRAKVRDAQRNAPLERQAQLYANITLAQKKRDNPDMDKDTLKREKTKALDGARKRMGAGKKRIGGKEVPLTEREWEAIQSGAVSKTLLNDILDNADMDVIKKYATPRQQKGLSSSQLSKAKALLANDATLAEVASQLGVSVTTLQRALDS